MGGEMSNPKEEKKQTNRNKIDSHSNHEKSIASNQLSV